MGFYSRCVFPRLCNLALSPERLERLRRELLASARGEVVEIGFGTGLNLPCYPEAVEGLTAVDPNPGMHRLAPRRAAARFPVELHLGRAEDLPFPPERFDTAVCTWTLCSVGDPAAALAEVRRVLRPGGRFLFLEHGLSHEAGVARWQRRLTPLQRRVSDGCRLDRAVETLVGESDLELEGCERFYQPRTPKILGYLYRGTARRPG